MDRQYTRSLITLKQFCGNYTAQGRLAFGSCMIETRQAVCKISVTVRHLIPARYQVCLVKVEGDGTRGLTLCDIEAADKGEGRCTLDADDVGGTGLPIEAFHIVAVVAQGGNDNTAILLEGYIEEARALTQNIPWREKLSFIPLSREESLPEETVLKESELSDETASEQQLSDEPLSEPAVTSTRTSEASAGPVSFQTAFQTMIAQFDKDLDELAVYVRMAASTAETPPPPAFKSDADTEPPDLTLSAARLFQENPKAGPLDGWENAEWVTVTPEELTALPRRLWAHQVHPFILAAFYRHGHLIFGRVAAKEARYFFGVPAFYHATAWTAVASLGFCSFAPRGGYLTPGAYGYWLMPL